MTGLLLLPCGLSRLLQVDVARRLVIAVYSRLTREWRLSRAFNRLLGFIECYCFFER